MSIHENPAKRLYDLIQDFCQKANGNPNVAALSIWQQVFNVGERDIFAKLTELGELVSDTANRLKSDPQVIKKERYLSWVEPVRATLMPGQIMSAASASVKTCYRADTSHMFMLDICSEALSKSHPENKITDIEISELCKSLDSLISEINQQVEDPNTRSFLLDLLASVEHGLRNFQIRGPVGLDDSLSLALGKLSRYKTVLDSCAKTDKTGMVGKAMAFIKGTADLADKAKKINDGATLLGTAYEQITSSVTSIGNLS